METNKQTDTPFFFCTYIDCRQKIINVFFEFIIYLLFFRLRVVLAWVVDSAVFRGRHGKLSLWNLKFHKELLVSQENSFTRIKCCLNKKKNILSLPGPWRYWGCTCWQPRLPVWDEAEKAQFLWEINVRFQKGFFLKKHLEDRPDHGQLPLDIGRCGGVLKSKKNIFLNFSIFLFDFLMGNRQPGSSPPRSAALALPSPSRPSPARQRWRTE